MLKYLLVTVAFTVGCTTIGDIEDTNWDNKSTIEEKSSCICPGEEERSEESLPYFNQYDNALHPGSSCQNLSLIHI